MKNKPYLLPLLAAAAVVIAIIAACALFFSRSRAIPLTVLDKDGNVLISAKAPSELAEDPRWAYLDLAVTEAAEILAEQTGSGAEEAKRNLLTGGFTIATCFDDDVFAALEQAHAQWSTDAPCALAVTDLKGGLLAVYAHSPDARRVNYAAARLSPYSALKPLSVYAPALEAGIIHWATMYEDSAYKQLPDSDGILRDWPANASGTYSLAGATVYEGIRKSLNTVAVKCLKDVGVKNALNFLTDAFGMPLEQELYLAKTVGEEEIIGNIAMGYLKTGVTPVEMAGYYQIFATGGIYTAPTAIRAMEDKEGNILYRSRPQETQAVSPATADTLNRMLQGVVSPSGTGTQANCTVPIAGKTGTGDDYTDNWFVGVTGAYSIAAWHGISHDNQADRLFALAADGIHAAKPHARKVFITHQTLYPVVYCAESGMAVSAGCGRIEIGYFTEKEPLPPCGIHENEKE